MKLYLMRHGRAGDAPTDAQRELTPSGRADVLAVGRLVRTRGLEGVPVLTSPLVRARQTAELVTEEAGCGLLAVTPILASGASLDELLALVGERFHDQGGGTRRHATQLLVGHMPDLGVLAGYLAWGERGRALDLSVGTMVALTVEGLEPAPRATLEWVLSPSDVD